ncbi:metallophosphoesterase [Agilicoccus flavus]|uniref:metallophosphoesterase n=1 Tax=Agilicoccus flavus TaxID=2775968 RepID=UPI001CF69B2B|nr:metallophosphoesterase [Agilicoccus flavus]
MRGPLKAAATTLAATAGAGAAGLAYAGLVERNAFVLRHATVPVLPPGSRPIAVLHLSDLHLMPDQRRKIAWVRDLARWQPDVVVNTGDNIAHRESVGPLLRAMEPFLGLPGAFVLGSNDYYEPGRRNPLGYFRRDRKIRPRTPRLPTDELVAGLAEGGWHDLTNTRGRLDVAGHRLDLVGVDDPHLGLDDYDRVAGPRADGTDVKIGVLHAPYTRVLDAMARDETDLVIAGHTHGGQLAIPFYGALVTNCDLDTGRVKGVSRWWPGANGIPSARAPEDAAWLNVSAGLGTSPYVPFRFACRPEASLLTLVPAPEASS